MASDARVSTTLPTHPKTKKLIKRHGAESAWSLVCLFLWTAANRSDGDLTGMTAEDIELAANWDGAEGAFVSALSDVGFIDGTEGAYVIHDWAEHNPWAAGANDRSESSKWAALCKRYGREGAADRMPDYADRMRGAHEPHAETMRTGCPASVSDTDTDTVSDTRIPPKAVGRSEDFEKFWEAYPNKTAKKTALRAWKAAKDRPDLPTVLAALDRYVRTKPSDIGWKNPSTWINGGCWLDAPANSTVVPIPFTIASTDVLWQLRIDAWERSPNTWLKDQWGPTPDKADCKAPKGLLAKPLQSATA